MKAWHLLLAPTLAVAACESSGVKPRPEPQAAQAATQAAPPSPRSWSEESFRYSQIAEQEPEDAAWTQTELSRLQSAALGAGLPSVKSMTCRKTICVVKFPLFDAGGLVLLDMEHGLFKGRMYFVDGSASGGEVTIFLSREGFMLPSAPNTASEAKVTKAAD